MSEQQQDKNEPNQQNQSNIKDKEGKNEEEEQQNGQKQEEKQQNKNKQVQNDKQQEQQDNNNTNNNEAKMQKSIVSIQKTIIKQQLWKPYDFLFPGGKLAKLIKINNIYKKNLPIRDMLDKFKYIQMTPVINMIGTIENQRGKFFAGIARAAFNTDAVIIDNGLACGLEKFTLRRGVKLIGVAPELEIKFPKINPSKVDPMELANGHTHLFLVNNPDKDLRWNGQVAFKVDLCIKIAEGKKRAQGLNRCKIVSILIGDAPFDVTEQLQSCVENQIPIIVVPGSKISNQLMKLNSGEDQSKEDNPELRQLMQKGHLFYCNSKNSEDIAQLTHLLLSITPW